MERTFVICLRNDAYPASLEKHKIYLRIADSEAESHQHIRVIDESGEDYLYPAEFFASIKLPEEIEQAIIEAA
jgi:hypothetical protein